MDQEPIPTGKRPEIKITVRTINRVKNQHLYDATADRLASMDVAPLREFYGDSISDDAIRGIQTMIEYSFLEFNQSESWSGKNAQPTLSDIKPSDPIDKKLASIQGLEEGETNTAFAGLNGVNIELQGHPTTAIRLTGTSIEDEVAKKLEQNRSCNVWDVGCGGQAADIMLLGIERFRNDSGLQVTGVGARDYGHNIRPLFPEFADRLAYIEENIFSGSFPTNVADVVFSARTLPYSGVVDIKRFTKRLHTLAKEGGTVWCGSVVAELFDFRGSKFKNIYEYMDYLRNEKGFHSLRYSTQGGLSLLWDTAEGFPFKDFIGTRINYDESGRPGSIVYSYNPR